jgi:hypothetical protein
MYEANTMSWSSSQQKRRYKMLHPPEHPQSYVLDDKGQPVAEPNIEKAFTFRKNNWKVRQTRYGPVLVSTVFLCLDHNWNDGPPILWETMIFGGKDSQYQQRYVSVEDALAGHRDVCNMVFTSLPWWRRLFLNPEGEEV